MVIFFPVIHTKSIDELESNMIQIINQDPLGKILMSRVAIFSGTTERAGIY